MKLSDFSLPGENDDQQILGSTVTEFNRTKTPYPTTKSVHRIFSEQALRRPEAIAVVAGARSLTYRDLEEQSNRLARFFVDRGLEPEDAVAVMLDRTPEMVATLLGILKAGGYYLPIHHDLPTDRIRFMLSGAHARFLVSEKKRMRELNRLQWECPDLKYILCIDSTDIHAEAEETTVMMKEEMWDFLRRDMFDDISGGGWKSSFTGQWLSREVMDQYGDNIRQKLSPVLTRNSRILEIGCASGISMFRLAPLVGFYLGTDITTEIIDWSEAERKRRELTNIRLQRMAAHEIDRLVEEDFDVVIINSVVQCFSGHNYFRDVIRKAIEKMKPEGLIFLGNMWDQDLKDSFTQSLAAFARDHASDGYTTKIDRSDELFIARDFLEDLRHDFPQIAEIEYSRMSGSAESELSQYGYDAVLRIDKRSTAKASRAVRRNFQFDQRILEAYSGSAVEERSFPDGLAYLIFTSGSTGQPKGVMVDHRSILRLVSGQTYVNLTEEDRILPTGALAFDASTFEIWGALLNGGQVCLPDGENLLDPKALGQLIDRHGVTICFLTTSFFNLLVDLDIGVFRKLKTLLTGGEKVSVQHFNAVRKRYPSLQLSHVYGPTENTTFTTCFHVKQTYERDIPIGSPISNTTAYILADDLSLTPIGIPGELFTGGDGLARGYLDDPVLTAGKFVPNPFAAGERLYRTGDVCRWLPDGNIEFLGRKDTQVKVRGYRIEPEEIEARLLEQEGVKQAIVLGTTVGTNGTELVAYFTGEPGLDADNLRTRLRKAVPEYMIPSYFIRLDKLPLNANGKVDRNSLPAPEFVGATAQRFFEPPATDTEKELSRIWGEVLNRKDVGATDDFFDLGGHSLKVTKLVSLIHKKMGVVLPLSIVFKASTLRELAECILDAAQFGVEGIDDAMVLLNGKSGGASVFAFPPGTGDALGFLQIAERLKPYSMYAFNFIESEDRMKRFASHVMSVDPEGPYVFFGYSSGGNLAYHVAREIESLGKCVSDIIMLDSGRRLHTIPYRDGEVERVIEDFLHHESITPYLTDNILREKAYRRIKASFDYLEDAVDLHVIDANIHVVLSEGSIDTYSDRFGKVLSTTSGWAEATRGRFETYQGFGDHNRMLHPGYLDQNSEVVRKILDSIASPSMRTGMTSSVKTASLA